MEHDASDEKPEFLDTRRKWLALASIVAALGMTAVWAYFLREAALGGHRYYSLRESGVMGRALGVFGFAGLFGGAACIRRKDRSWTRFFSIYTAVLVLQSPSLGHLKADADAVVDRFVLARAASSKRSQLEPQARDLDERRRNVDREIARLNAELLRTPPLSAEGLASIGSISASESRITELLTAEDAVDDVVTSAITLGLEPKRGGDATLTSLYDQQKAATRELFVAIRQVLHRLRMTWGVWKLDAGSSAILYSKDADQREFVELAGVVANKQANLTKINEEVRARQATHPWPR